MEREQWEIPVHRSLVRPLLLMGGERELVLMLAILAGIFILSLFKLWAAIAGVALWVVGIYALNRAAEHDPKLSKVLARSAKYMLKKHIPSAATPFALPSHGKE